MLFALLLSFLMFLDFFLRLLTFFLMLLVLECLLLLFFFYAFGTLLDAAGRFLFGFGGTSADFAGILVAAVGWKILLLF